MHKVTQNQTLLTNVKVKIFKTNLNNDNSALLLYL